MITRLIKKLIRFCLLLPFYLSGIGFVYMVINKSENKSYIGKKVLWFHRTLKPLKGKKRRRKITKESDWLTYYGSNEEIKKLLKEGQQFHRKILQFAFTKKQLTYLELKYQMANEVLENPNKFYNSNILGKYFRKDLELSI